MPSPTNPRRTFDATALQELARSIGQDGVITPIVLRPNGTPSIPGKPVQLPYELVAGERRWRASKIAGKDTIAAEIRDMTDEEVRSVQILENLQREDLGPMEEAEGYAQLAKDMGLGAAEIAQKLGKQGSYVQQRLRLLDLVKPVREALRSGEITFGFALEIAKLSVDAEQKRALELCSGYGAPRTVEQFRDRLDKEFRLLLAAAPFSLKDATLHPDAPACEDCPKRTGANSLLFGDVQADDRCTDPKCYGVKVQTVIHVRLGELKKTQPLAPLVSMSYMPPSNAPKGVMGTKSYTHADKPWTPCGNSIFAIAIDGDRQGQKIRICIDKGCKTHRGNVGITDEAHAKKRAAEAAKERLDTAIRLEVAQAFVAGVLGGQAPVLSDEMVLELVDYAFVRMDHAQDGRFAKLLGWDKNLVGYRDGTKRLDKLREMGAARASMLGMLAIAASDLTAQHTYGPTRPNRLFKLAQAAGVDVAGIKARVTAAAAAKAKGKKKVAEPEKKPATKKPTVKKTSSKSAAGKAPKKGQRAKPVKLSPEARKKIVTGMKQRVAATKLKSKGKGKVAA